MLKRLAPLVPMSFVLLLAACASHSPEPQVAKEPTAARAASTSNATRSLGRMLRTKGRTIHRLVRLRWRPASSSAFELIGTPYRFGGTTAKASIAAASSATCSARRPASSCRAPPANSSIWTYRWSPGRAAARRPAVLQQPWPWPRQPRRHLHRRWPVHPFRQPSRRRGAGGQPGLQLLEPELHGSKRVLEPGYKDALTSKR